jgi:hypothetical protein
MPVELRLLFLTVSGQLTLLLSLFVTTLTDEVVGHAAFSPVLINGREIGRFSLGPSQYNRGFTDAVSKVPLYIED